MQARAPIQAEEVYCQEDGCHTYLTIKFPMYDSTRTIYGVCCIATDISDRKINELELQKSHDRLKSALEDTITAVAKAVEARDLYVAGHQRRVTQLAVAIAGELGLDEDMTENGGASSANVLRYRHLSSLHLVLWRKAEEKRWEKQQIEDSEISKNLGINHSSERYLVQGL